MSVHQSWSGRQGYEQMTFQPHYLAIMHAIDTDLKAKQLAKMTFEELLQVIAPHVFAVFSMRWASFGAAMLQYIADSECKSAEVIERISAGLFDNFTALDKCFSGRTVTLFTIFDSLLCGDTKITDVDYSTQLTKLREQQDRLALSDLSLSSLAAWVSFWASEIQPQPLKTRVPVCRHRRRRI